MVQTSQSGRNPPGRWRRTGAGDPRDLPPLRRGVVHRQAEWFPGSVDCVSAIELAVPRTGRLARGWGGSTLISRPGGRLHCSCSRVSGTGYRCAIGTGAASGKVGPHPAGGIIGEVPPGRCLGGMTATDHSALMRAWPTPIEEEELA